METLAASNRYHASQVSDAELRAVADQLQRTTASQAFPTLDLARLCVLHPDAASAGGFFKRWFMHAVRSKLPPVVKAARTLKRHLPGLLNYFSHRITNALSEGLNSPIQAVKAAARGFHGFGTFRTRILFFLGGLDLKPR